MKARKMNGIVWPLIGLVVVSLLLGACGSAGSSGGSQGKVLQSKVRRIQNPKVSEGDVAALVDGNTAFAFDLYQGLDAGSGNLFFSPYSLSTVLAMTYAGARNQTADQMAQVLQFTLPQESLHPAFNALDVQLSRLSGSQNKDVQPFQLDVANSLWGQRDEAFNPEYLDLLAQNYGAGLRLVDFAQNAEAARQEINGWVSERTQDKIKDLIPPGGVGPNSRLVLANAIYFKADWQHPFEGNTSDRPFHLLDGSQVDVPSMSFEDAQTLPYLDGDGFQAVELPYVGDEVSMLVLVPDQGELENFEAGLDSAHLGRILDQARPTQVELLLPKFEFTAEYQLANTLSGMGMPDAFCNGASDFSGMDAPSSTAPAGQGGQLCIDEIFHKAFVKVDEKGTEAAAASAVVMRALAIQGDQPVVLDVDRPFLFVIRHNPTGSILFLGRVANPQS